MAEVLKGTGGGHFTEAAESMLLKVSGNTHQALLIIANGADRADVSALETFHHRRGLFCRLGKLSHSGDSDVAIGVLWTAES
ncbi:hypothetical protein D3C81_2066580 [compost metagenome]